MIIIEKSEIKPMGYAIYHAICWAQGKTVKQIQDEIERCEIRYLKPYTWNGTENAQYTIDRIETLKKLL